MSVTQQIRSLEMQRGMLHGLVDLVLSLEQLRASVEAVMLRGSDPELLSAAQWQSIDVIRQRVARHSNEQLRSAIDSLDRQVNDALHELLTLAMQLADTKVSKTEREAFHLRVNRFNRNARTAITLHVLLAQRGDALPGIVFSLPQEAINARLQKLDADQQQVRQTVEERLHGMQEDINVSLQNPACAPAQQAIFLAMQQSLAENLAHIRAGLSLAELPMPIDDIEEENKAGSELPPPPEFSAEPATPGAPIAPQQPAADSPAAPPGLIPRVRNWLHSPRRSRTKIDDQSPD